MNKVLNPDKAELRLAISYEEQKKIVERYRAAGYEVPEMSILLRSHMKAIMRVIDTYIQSITLAAIENDGVIDDQERDIITKAKAAADTFEASLIKIIEEIEGKPYKE